MSNTNPERQFMAIELAAGIKVHTAIATANQPALRSGFAGYPVNPRWGAGKYRAWKTGRQWRESLHRGELVVRSSDSMLVKVNSTPQKSPNWFQRTKKHQSSRA